MVAAQGLQLQRCTAKTKEGKLCRNNGKRGHSLCGIHLQQHPKLQVSKTIDPMAEQIYMPLVEDAIPSIENEINEALAYLSQNADAEIDRDGAASKKNVARYQNKDNKNSNVEREIATIEGRATTGDEHMLSSIRMASSFARPPSATDSDLDRREAVIRAWQVAQFAAPHSPTKPLSMITDFSSSISASPQTPNRCPPAFRFRLARSGSPGPQDPPGCPLWMRRKVAGKDLELRLSQERLPPRYTIDRASMPILTPVLRNDHVSRLQSEPFRAMGFEAREKHHEKRVRALKREIKSLMTKEKQRASPSSPSNSFPTPPPPPQEQSSPHVQDLHGCSQPLLRPEQCVTAPRRRHQLAQQSAEQSHAESVPVHKTQPVQQPAKPRSSRGETSAIPTSNASTPDHGAFEAISGRRE